MTKANGKMATNPRLDKVIACYIQIRDYIAEEKKRQKEMLAKYEHNLEVCAAEIMKTLDKNGVQSARTKSGTATLGTQESASCSDANMFMDYVKEQQAFELLNRHPNPTACKEHAKTHGQLPPGVKLNIKRTVKVNSPREELSDAS